MRGVYGCRVRDAPPRRGARRDRQSAASRAKTARIMQGRISMPESSSWPSLRSGETSCGLGAECAAAEIPGAGAVVRKLERYQRHTRIRIDKRRDQVPRAGADAADAAPAGQRTVKHDGSINTSAIKNNYILVYGPFMDGFVIVDRFPSQVELIPNMFGSNRRPAQGQRGASLWARTGSDAVVPQSFRLLNIEMSNES
ncbi:hypothetical protein [Mycobacterium sp.]|uniref:hypothetical protein n=1 Tax=Mycobacterium sp. TaxID=1785 RepID=UPI003F95B22F